MKLHLPLLLLSALLALMPARAEDDPYSEYRFWVPSNHPDYPLAFIRKSSKYTQIPYTYFVPGAELNTGDAAAQMDFFFKSASGVHLTAASIFNTWGYGFHMDSSTLDASLGSIMFTEAELANVTLNTKCDNATSDEWGLPQVALMQASFLEGTTTVNSNFFSVNFWEATGDNTFNLNKTFGSLRVGQAEGNVTIHSDKGAEIYNLKLAKGALVIDSSSSVVAENWSVDLRNVQSEDGVQVNAESNSGQINVTGITTSDSATNSFFAKGVNLNSKIQSRILTVYAGESALLKDVEVKETLRVLSTTEGTHPNITFDGSLTAGTSISLEGKDIRGTAPGAVLSSSQYDIEATGEVNIQGTFQGGDSLTITAGGAVSLGVVGTLQNPLGSVKITNDSNKTVSMESFLGDNLIIEAGGIITLKSLGSLEKTVKSAKITGKSAAPVAVKSFHGGENGTLQIDSHGIVTIGRQKEQGSADIPAYEGNVTVNYLGEGTGAENWDVDMLGVMQGSLTVNAAAGKVNAGHIVGSGDITAKQINIASFSGSNLDIKASNSVTVGGNLNVAGTAEKPATITAGEEVVLNAQADLAHTNITAPQVIVGMKLTLQESSRIEGNVTVENGANVAVQNSTITGNVGGTENQAATVALANSTITGTVSNVATLELTNSTIGSLEKFSELKVQSASSITSDLVVSENAKLSFELNLEKRATAVLTIGGELKVDNPDNPAFEIDLDTDKLLVSEKYALITTTAKDKAPEFWDIDRVTLSGLSSDETTLFWEGNTLYFSLGGPELEAATWTGNENSHWNKQHVNWEQKGDQYLYKDGVAVVFNDTGKEQEVVLDAELAPRSVLVENSAGHDYTFAGEGKLIGKTVLVKQGNGTLTVNTANDYTGGTTISGGTLVMGNGNAFGSGDVKLGDATLNLAGHTLDNNVSVTGGNAYLGNGTLVGKLNVEDGRKLTLSGKLEGESTITLGREATLDLGGNTLSPQVKLTGNATIGNGEIIKGLTMEAGRTLTLGGDLKGSGTIFLGQNSTLDLCGHTLSNKVVMTGDLGYLNTGILNGSLEVGDAHRLTLLGTLLRGEGVVHLGDKSSLDLHTYIFCNDITITGEASIYRGMLSGNTLTVAVDGKLTLGDCNVDTAANLKLILGDKASANLGGNSFSGTVALEGDASIGNGTLNAEVAVGAGKTLTVCNGDLGGSGAIRLAELSKLDLGGTTLAKTIVLDGSAYIGNGTLSADLTVGAGNTLTLSDNLGGSGTVILNEKSHLNTYSGGLNPNILHNAVEVAGNATIHGTFYGKLSVDAGKKLELQSGTIAAGGVLLGHGTTLDLGGNRIDSPITLAGDAAIGNGTVNADVTVGAGHKLSLTSNLEGTGTVILNENSGLNTHGDEVYPYILNNAVKVAGNASIKGSFYGQVAVDAGKRLVFESGTTAAGGIALGHDADLDMGGNKISTTISLTDNASMGNGTINSGSLDVADSRTLTLWASVNGTRTISLGYESTLCLKGSTSVGNKITGGLSATIVKTEPDTTATLTGGLSGFTGNVKVEKGVLNIMDAVGMGGVDVTLGRRATLGVYKDANAVEASEGTLTITGDHKLAAAFHATLNGNLVMEAGSTLDVSATRGDTGGLHMGSTLTLDPGNVLLSDADMDAVSGLRCMQAYDLFSGVDALFLDNGANFLVELGLTEPWVKASEVFANDLFKSAEREYYLFYSGANQGGGVAGYAGTVYLLRVPEPATGTLSLLALAALAARRRRK